MPKAKPPPVDPEPQHSLGEGVTIQQAAAHVATSDQEPETDTLGFFPLTEATTRINALWYGVEGTGKTTAIAGMANLGKILIVNAEAGLHLKPLKQHGVNVDNIVVWPPPGQKVTFDGLEKVFWRLNRELSDDPNSWVGVGLDSLTEIAQTLLEDVVAGAVKKATKLGRDRDRFFTDRADYGTMGDQVRLLIRRFRDLPCHFAVTCLERRDTDDDTGKVKYGPALTPALQTNVLGYMDFVLYNKAEAVGNDTEFRALTRARGKYRAKDRFDVTPPVLITPTFERIAGYVAGDLTLENDPEQKLSDERHQAANETATAGTKTEKGSGNAEAK